ncbi:hypothetical protein ACW95P_00110 [Candidatus Mycoplasma pogonae]
MITILFFGSYTYDAEFSVTPYNSSTFISMANYTYNNIENKWKL